MGGFPDLFYADLTPSAMRDEVINLLARGDIEWIIEARFEEGYRPIGIVVAEVVHAARGIHPHVDWFPWSTARQKFEGVATFLREVKREFKIYVFAAEEDWNFYYRLSSYRLLFKGGKVFDHFSRGEHARLFYSAGP